MNADINKMSTTTKHMENPTRCHQNLYLCESIDHNARESWIKSLNTHDFDVRCVHGVRQIL